MTAHVLRAYDCLLCCGCRQQRLVVAVVVSLVLVDPLVDLTGHEGNDTEERTHHGAESERVRPTPSRDHEERHGEADGRQRTDDREVTPAQDLAGLVARHLDLEADGPERVVRGRGCTEDEEGLADTERREDGEGVLVGEVVPDPCDARVDEGEEEQAHVHRHLDGV